MDLEYLVRVAEHWHAVYIPSEGLAEPRELALGVASLFEGRVRVFEVRDDLVSQDQGASFVNAMTSSSVVVVFGSSESNTIQKLGHHWPDYIEHAAHTPLRIGFNITFKPTARPSELASLMLVVSRLTSDHKSDRPGVFKLEAQDVARLVENGRRTPIEVEILGLDPMPAAQEISIKELCFLHHRDEIDGSSGPTPDRRVRSEKLSWEDLQSILQTEPEALFNGQHKNSLDPEKFAYGRAAADFLLRLDQNTGGVFPDIFSAVWFGERAFQPKTIFRGQFNACWGLECKLLRPPIVDGRPVPLDLEELMKRVSETELFLAKARASEVELFGGKIDENSLLAVAQHFGFPTPLLDFTCNLRVAAFFATREAKVPSEQAQPPIGVIYHYRLAPGQSEIVETEASDSKFHDLVGMRIGSTRPIRPNLVGADDRIGRQEGVFMYGHSPSDLQAVGIERLYFRQQPGLCFEDERLGITERHLLSDESKIGKLASKVRESSPKRKVLTSTLIGQSKLNTKPVVGSAGGNLGWHMNFGPLTVNELEEKARAVGASSLADAMNSITERYFLLARAEAETGSIIGESKKSQWSHPLGETIAELESKAGLASGEIWQIINPYFPKDFEEGGIREVDVPSGWDQPARLALSFALFLAAWEHLRNVGGWKAQDLVQAARFLLRN